MLKGMIMFTKGLIFATAVVLAQTAVAEIEVPTISEDFHLCETTQIELTSDEFAQCGRLQHQFQLAFIGMNFQDYENLAKGDRGAVNEAAYAEFRIWALENQHELVELRDEIVNSVTLTY
mgnify:CR=1 FL=1